MPEDQMGILYTLFAELLEYPSPATLRRAGECLEQLKAAQPDAAALLADFCSGLEKRTLEQAQELYTSTFDVQPVCYPYAGYQLFGETYKRGAFMARLNEAYHASGYSAGKELPDHVSVILRYLALDPTRQHDDFGRALLHEGLKPALKKMTEALEKQVGNPYRELVSALSLLLSRAPETEMDHA